ncbi:MAG: HD domain-containing protein [bacterium]
MKQSHHQKLASFFYELGTLRRVLRAHQQMLLAHDPTDNIASHSFRAAFIGYFLAKELKADADKVLKMCLLHDIEEIRTNDHNWVHRRYTKMFDEEVRAEQLNDFVGAKELLAVSHEYGQRMSFESKIAKDADLLDQVLLMREYEWGGNKEAKNWLHDGHGQRSAQEKQMNTKLAKDIAKEIKKQDPSFWWANLWTPKRRK